MPSEANRAALVTNAVDFAGPPAVDALLGAEFRVMVHDKSFADEGIRRTFSAEHPGVDFIEAANHTLLVDAACKAAGKIDVLVSNDHHPASCTPSETASLEAFHETLEALVVGPFALVKSAIPHMKHRESGKIIMITSCRTSSPVAGAAIPDAARAAANALVRSLAVELAPFHISINAVAPNFLASEAYYPRAFFADDLHGRAFIEAQVPAKRLGRPDEIGEVIRFLAETHAQFLTGAIIDFAGGWPQSPAPPKSR